MKIFILFSLIILAISFISKKIFYLFKRNLFKDQAAWSGKDIKIKHINSKDKLDSKEINNFLKTIADESKIYLDDQSNKEEE
tara:strand:+ start:294 stop:539 length:246 start_codon:yes stop_codon:yes gene_type:complete